MHVGNIVLNKVWFDIFGACGNA